MNECILRSYIRVWVLLITITMPHLDEKKNTPGINVNLLFMLLKPKDDGLFDMVIGVGMLHCNFLLLKYRYCQIYLCEWMFFDRSKYGSLWEKSDFFKLII